MPMRTAFSRALSRPCFPSSILRAVFRDPDNQRNKDTCHQSAICLYLLAFAQKLYDLPIDAIANPSDDIAQARA